MVDDKDKYSNRATNMLIADLQMKTDLTEAQREKYAGAIEALKKMPGVRIRDQILYVQDQLLPTIAAKRGGKDTADYKFFESIIESLKWCLVLYDRMEALMRKDSLLHLERTLLLERIELYEKELLKYATLEDLYLTDMLDRVDEGVRARLKALSEGKKS